MVTGFSIQFIMKMTYSRGELIRFFRSHPNWAWTSEVGSNPSNQ